jgi:hypothetical protein
MPLATPTELLTDEFYRWEQRGRGWQVWPYPVELEPPFQPFLFHGLSVRPVRPGVDDARKPTALGSFLSRLRDRLAPSLQPSQSVVLPDGAEDDSPDLFAGSDDLVTVRVALRRDHEVGREAAEQMLLGLAASSALVSFELVGDPAGITVQVTARAEDSDRIVSQLEAYFPDATIQTDRDRLSTLVVDAEAEIETAVIDFGLAHEFMRPLGSVRTFAVDPLIGVASALGALRHGEFAVLQVLFRRARYPWAESIQRAVSDNDGGSFFVDAPEMPRLAAQKVAHPLLAAVIRAAAWSPEQRRAREIVSGLDRSLRVLANPPSNELMPLDDEGYEPEEHAADVLARRSHRSGMLLSSDELVSLVHLPSASVRSPRLLRDVARSRAAPDVALEHSLVLGENTHRGQTVPVTLGAAHRVRHTYVIGASGTGKSTLLLSMILQDIDQGRGCAVLDPHGDLVEAVLGRIPERRHRDVIVFDPSDEEWPVGFNPLQAHSELEKTLLSSDLVALFRRFATSWGDQMTAVLGNAILAFLERESGGTLVDLRRFLIEPAFRRSVLGTVQDPQVVYYFEREYPLLKGNPAASILTRLDAFLRPKLVRHMVGQREDRIDFRAIMDEGRVFLGKLAQGAIGEENAHLLGSLLVSRFHQVALGRQDTRESERPDYFVYLDEFHHLATPSLTASLSGARKYHLGLVLAHQELRQLTERDPALADAVLTNAATRVCFRVGDTDARKLAEGFSSFDASDLQSLGVGEAIGRVERADWDFSLRTHAVAPVMGDVAARAREAVVALSRAAYASERQQVAAALAETTKPPAEPKRIVTPPSIPTAAHHKVAVQAKESVVERVPAPAMLPGPARSRVVMPTPGRGGSEHKYLQQLVKRLAEARGWRATIEASALGGAGNVDVSLERAGRRIAVEISVSTSAEHEVANVQKCLAAGFDRVVVVVRSKRAVHALADAIEATLGTDSRVLVEVTDAEGFVALLDEEEATAAGQETHVRGYKVRVRYSAAQASDAAFRKQAISKVLLNGMSRVQ